MTFNPKVAAAVQNVTTGGAASALFGIFQGRCTFAAICFSVVGVIGWLHGRDLTSYALFVTSIQGLLVLHSWKSDIHEQRCARFEVDKLKSKVTSDLETGNADTGASAGS